MLKIVFENLGLVENCKFFKNGKKVVDYYAQTIINEKMHKKLLVIVIDFEMPIMSGIEAIKEIRNLHKITNENIRSRHELLSSEASKHVPDELCLPKFLMFSSHLRPRFSDFTKDHGVDHVIQKPPNQEEIFTLLLGFVNEH